MTSAVAAMMPTVSVSCWRSRAFHQNPVTTSSNFVPTIHRACVAVLVEEPSAQTLRRAGVDWVVIQEHPLPFSQLTPALRQVLHDSADLVVSFDPFVAGAVKPPFDPIDAFYAPIAEFSSVRFGGPIIRIYRFHQRL